MGMPAAQSAMSRPQRQGQPNFQQFLQQLMAARKQGLFGQQGQGMSRFVGGGSQMPPQMMPQPVQQMSRPMFQRPQPQQSMLQVPAQALSGPGLFGGISSSGGPMGQYNMGGVDYMQGGQAIGMGA